MLAPYVEAARRVASAERCCSLVDLHAEWPSASLGASKGSADGLHLDASGNAFVYRLVAAQLKAEGLDPHELRSHLPHWLHVAAPRHIDWNGNKLPASFG